MTTQTKKTSAFTESHILNGSVNLNYNLAQFLALPEPSRASWLWSANIALRGNIEYSDCQNPEKHQELFTKVKNIPRPSSAPVSEINGKPIHSAAHGMTLLGYGDSSTGEAAKIKCRSLDFNVKCEDKNDLMRCLRTIGSYNDFNAANIIRLLNIYGAKTAVYSETNPNNGNDLFKYYIARESSPAFYIQFSEYLAPKAEALRNGAYVESVEYTGDDFKADMDTLQTLIKCDEFSIQETQITKAHKSFTARFWFD